MGASMKDCLPVSLRYQYIPDWKATDPKQGSTASELLAVGFKIFTKRMRTSVPFLAICRPSQVRGHGLGSVDNVFAL